MRPTSAAAGAGGALGGAASFGSRSARAPELSGSVAGAAGGGFPASAGATGSSAGELVERKYQSAAPARSRTGTRILTEEAIARLQWGKAPAGAGWRRIGTSAASQS